MADPTVGSLLPSNDPVVTPADDLAAAAAGAVALPPSQIPAQTPPVVPFGRTWQFDWERGQFVRAGASPAGTSGLGAVQEWCQMAIHSARYAHPVFSDAFGMDQPDEVMGEFPIGEALSDWQTALIEALLVHDRITAVENFDIEWDPTTGILEIHHFDVVTDRDQRFTVSDITVQAGGYE